MPQCAINCNSDHRVTCFFAFLESLLCSAKEKENRISHSFCTLTCYSQLDSSSHMSHILVTRRTGLFGLASLLQREEEKEEEERGDVGKNK